MKNDELKAVDLNENTKLVEETSAEQKGQKNDESKEANKYTSMYWIFALYGLLGIILEKTSFLTGVPEIPVITETFVTINIYIFPFMYTAFWALTLLEKSGNIFIGFIDKALCIMLLTIFPYPIPFVIYDDFKNEYNVMTAMFLVIPFIDYIFKKDKKVILKVVTRALMIGFLVLIIISLKSCGKGIAG